jgi:hypothetical protein
MTREQRWVGLALGSLAAMVGLIVAAHSGKAAPEKTKGTTAMLTGATPKPAPLARTPVAKPAPRESAFSTYTSAEYGASFRYPRNFPLDEGPLDEVTDQTPGLRNQAELEGEQPGALLVATIAVPDDSFPNTTFAGGSVQFAINRYLPGGDCQDYPVKRTGDAKSASGVLTVGGVPFMWADSDQGEGDKEFYERTYAGFANDSCYEFFVRVGVESVGDSEQAKPVNQKKILGQLEKIVVSTQLQPKTTSMLDKQPTKATPRTR